MYILTEIGTNISGFNARPFVVSINMCIVNSKILVQINIPENI